MEVIVYSICIAIWGFIIGHITGFSDGLSKGLEKGQEIAKDVYDIKEVQTTEGRQLNWLEPSAHNGVVVGSSPTRPTKPA